MSVPNAQPARRMLPPTYLVAALAGIVALAAWAPGVVWLPWPASLVGVPLIAAGLGLILWAAALFDRARTSIKPFEESAALVVGGPYRLSRNPMYLGMVLLLFGAAAASGAATSAAIPILFAAIVHRRFIDPEEVALEERFGAIYLEYCGNVRRWL